MAKHIIYYLNGKKIDKETVKKRAGAKLAKVHTIEERHFEAPLTEAERIEKGIEAKNASDYFSKMRADREDLEKRHG